MKEWEMNKKLMALLTLIVFCSAVPAARADGSRNAANFLKEKVTEVINTLQQPNLAEKTKKEKLSHIASSLFDFPLMAKLSLGKEHWFSLSKGEQKQFTDLFIERLKSVYLNKMVHYTNEEVRYGTAFSSGRKVQIPTYLLSNGKEISISYRLYQSGNSWKLYDVEIQDVSLVQSYKAQFDEILRNGTTADLLNKLEQPQP
jgi:phospholipid transport system substrate-binding protein